MTRGERRAWVRAFRSYVAAYDLEDPKIRLKLAHSLRVADLCERIAETISHAKAGKGWSKGDLSTGLAWKIGLLHDIGRFEQIRRYHTFVDARSVDHASLGADLLFREGLLNQLMGEPRREEPAAGPGLGQLMGEPRREEPAAGSELSQMMGEPRQEEPAAGSGMGQPLRGWTDLSQGERRLMETAIRNHSLYRLPEGLTGEERAYCDLLRDADKIDIFRVHCETPLEEIYDVTREALMESAVSEEVKDCFLRRTAVLRSLKKTPADFIVGHACLRFELVYPVSVEMARRQGYLDQMLDFPSENPDTSDWFALMRRQIWEDRGGNGDDEARFSE